MVLSIARSYILWHYSEALTSYIVIWRNFVWFVFHFFSISTLARTLFQPFQRMQETYKKGLELEDWAGTFVVNTLMRLVGATVRLVIIAIGLVTITITALVGAIGLVIWLFLPFILLFSLFVGPTYATFMAF